MHSFVIRRSLLPGSIALHARVKMQQQGAGLFNWTETAAGWDGSVLCLYVIVVPTRCSTAGPGGSFRGIRDEDSQSACRTTAASAVPVNQNQQARQCVARHAHRQAHAEVQQKRPHAVVRRTHLSAWWWCSNFGLECQRHGPARSQPQHTAPRCSAPVQLGLLQPVPASSSPSKLADAGTWHASA